MNAGFLSRIKSKMQRDFASVLSERQLNASSVIVHFDTPPLGFDPNRESTYGTPASATRVLPALVHFVSAKSTEKSWQQFDTGDVVLFILPTADLSGANLRFEIAGDLYVQKDVGKSVVPDWSLIMGDDLIHTCLLLTKK